MSDVIALFASVRRNGNRGDGYFPEAHDREAELFARLVKDTRSTVQRN